MDVVAPVPGKAIPLSETPDPVFAGAMVGPGMAIDPDRSEITAVAPISGQVAKLHAHAYVIVGDAGSVLVHLGIDTVQLKGEGFTLHVEENSTVQAGESVVTWNPAEVEAGGKSPVCPVVALEGSAEALSNVVESGQVSAGDLVFNWS